MKPRIFLGSSGKQEKLLQALTRGLEASRTSSPGPHPSIQGPPPSNASSNWRTRSTSLRSYSRGTTGRAAVQGRPRPQGRVRLLHETTSSSRPASSAEPSECVGPSFSTRAAPSSRAISSASRAYDTKRRRPLHYWKGERLRDPNAPQLDGTGEIRIESADRAAGYFTTRADARPQGNARTAGVYWRADPADMTILDGSDERQRAELIAARIRDWKSITKA